MARVGPQRHRINKNKYNINGRCSYECNAKINSEELIGTTDYRTELKRYRINRCRYNRVLL